MSVVRAGSYLEVPRGLIVRPLLGFAAGLAVTMLALAVVAPPLPREAIAEEPGALAQLERAVRELEDACVRAEEPLLLPQGAPAFVTSELELALASSPLILAHEGGELDALRREARWLSRLHPDGAGLGPQRSWEDARFMLGFFHWYLDCALAAGLERAGRPARPARHAWRPYDPARLRELRGHDFRTLLGSFD